MGIIRNITITLLLIIMYSNAYALGNAKFDLFKKQYQEIKTELTGIENAVANLDVKITGVDQSIKASAGRDNIITDPKIIVPVFMGLIGVILILIRGNMATRKYLLNTLKSKNEYKKKLEENNGKNNRDSKKSD
jgi:hypothetical protein